MFVLHRSPQALQAGLRGYLKFNNHEQPHSARDHLPPGYESPPEQRNTIRLKDVVCETRLGGVLKSYSRRAA